jgi:8-oxo-dGTP pyrophosphatase MutT (NUDIX family)
MNNGYIIYFGDKPYYIVNHLWPELYAQTNIAGTIIANQPDSSTIPKTIKDMDLPGTKAVIILTDDPEHYWTLFQKQFTPIWAGGGIVKNEVGELLFMYRRGKWDLPKGKWDDGETLAACALREVREETGLREVSIVSELGNTYHIYTERGKKILKFSRWYAMEATENQLLVPQAEEDILELKWVAADRLDELLGNTYPSIKIILRQYFGG